MRRYIIAGSILLALSMACEEKKKPKPVEAQPQAKELVLSSPVEIALPSVPSEAPVAEVPKEKEKTAVPKPMTMAAKVLPRPSPVQYEDVSSRVLAEGSRDEAKDIGLAKIREKAVLRMKEMQAKEKAEEDKALAEGKVSADAEKVAETAVADEAKSEAVTPSAEAPSATTEAKDETIGSKVAMVEPESLQAAETQVKSEAAKDQTEVDEAPITIKNSNIDSRKAKTLEMKFRKARDLAKAGKVEAAKSLFLNACQAGHIQACHKFAWYEEQAGNGKNATRFYRAACENGLGKSCNNLAFQFEQLKIYDKALELYARGCMEKHEASCASLKRIREEQQQDVLQTR